MKTIKVIDIYEKIANGEEVPKKIKWKLLEEGYQTLIYNEDEQEYTFEVNEFQFYKFPLCHLNDEVEIIEDTPKKIDRVSLLDVKTDYKLKDILNKIIDKINGEEK